LLDLSEEAKGISLKCDPELAIELRELHTEVTPAYHFNKIIISF
jgi:predicted DNA-binding protein (MmcQ/YjbR family)